MAFKKDELIFLLGAGASVEAGIPASCGMISELENLLNTNNDWKDYAPVYHFIKSSIIYADGIQGKFEPFNFNIERLINTIDELLKSDEHPLFPFIGSWTPKLPEVSDNNFKKLSDFRKKIVIELRDHWVQLEYEDNAAYYSGLSAFQEEYQYPLRIFTLNYDLCVEKACLENGVERGFGEGRNWDWRIFDNEEEIQKNIFLYKLHGSIDWIRDDDSGFLTYKNSSIPPEKLEIIFGTTYKLQYIDPFLFFAYEFRKRILSDAKVLISIGYGFADEHINGIISQALKGNPSRKLLVVSRSDDQKSELDQIKKTLDTRLDENIVFSNTGAKQFFKNNLNLSYISNFFPEEEAPFDEL